MGVISYLHSMPAGDLLSLMPSIKQMYETTGKKAIIYQKVNHSYGMFGAYLGAVYSILDERGIPVTMNEMVFNAIRPLLLAQEYIEDLIVWEGQQYDINFDLIRENPSTLPNGAISRWAMYIWPEMATDLSKEAITIPYKIDQRVIGKIIVNRTERYNNSLISYNFLKKYEGNVIFVGLPKEHEVFCRQNKLDILRLEAQDFLEIATALYNCKFYIGNQSSCFQIAEHLKIQRVLEVCNSIPNVIGSGPGFYDFLTQKSLEYYVEKLFNS